VTYKRSSGPMPKHGPKGSSRAPQHSVRYSFVKERARDLRELAVLGPDPGIYSGLCYLSTQIFCFEQEAGNPDPTRVGQAGGTMELRWYSRAATTNDIHASGAVNP